MPTTPTQIRIDANIKKEASALFSSLGLDMSGAVNLFLHQCVLRGGLPFAVEMPPASTHYNHVSYDSYVTSKLLESEQQIAEGKMKYYSQDEVFNAVEDIINEARKQSDL